MYLAQTLAPQRGFLHRFNEPVGTVFSLIICDGLGLTGLKIRGQDVQLTAQLPFRLGLDNPVLGHVGEKAARGLRQVTVG